MSAFATDFIDYSYEVYLTTLQQNPANEVPFRTIINRSYYGAFLIARDFAGIKGNHNVHTRVIYYYESNKHSAISAQLRNLKLLRQTADYNLSSDINRKLAKASYSLASKISRRSTLYRSQT
ncbi:MAG: hypothetical protein K8963_06795 [Proteobacteria bacterium]|nr:hypothetical protein [Pseudomonadota bacterium]